MRQTKSKESRRVEFIEAAEGMYERMEKWCEENPEASFDEIAAEVGQERRGLMGQLLADLATQSAAEVEATERECPECSQRTEGKGQRSRGISHSEGEVKLSREYRYCQNCGRGFFPPGPETGADKA